MIMAIIIDTILYSARIDNKVVKVPVPAIKGKAKGTTEAVFGRSSFEILIPNIISVATTNNKIEPAIAKSPI